MVERKRVGEKRTRDRKGERVKKGEGGEDTENKG